VPDGSAFCNWCGAKLIKPPKGETLVPKARKLDSGTWYIQLRLGGQSVPVKADTEAKCKRLAAQIKEEYKATKKLPEADTKTVGEAMDDYINARLNTASPSTIMGYKSIRRTRFLSIADKPVNSIKDWQTVVNDEAALCSAKTLKNAWGFLSAAVNTCGGNAAGVMLPQVSRASKAYLEPEQIHDFLGAIKGDDCELPALLALHSLRRSEILGLTWDNVDIANKRLLVSGSVVPDEHYKLTAKSTNKTASSRRYVPIMIDRLGELLEEQRQQSGPVVNMHPNTIFKHINRICAKNGLPEIGIHGLRHSFASLAYHLGVSEQAAMQIGGWSDYGTMRRIYTHLAAKDLAKHEQRLTAFFNGNANQNAN
jgi:integrase